MAKLKSKTHKATVKRFKMTKGGKLMHKRQGNNNHYMTKKSGGRKLRVEKNQDLSARKEAKKIKSLGNF